MTLRLNCLQLVLLGEDNFYSNTAGYTVVVRHASEQRTDVNTPEHVQPIQQGCPLTLGITPL